MLECTAVYYIIPQIVHETLPLAATPNNIQSVFHLSGTETSLLKMNSSHLLLQIAPGSTGSISIEIGMPEISGELVAREIMPPSSSTIFALSATFINAVDAHDFSLSRF